MDIKEMKEKDPKVVITFTVSERDKKEFQLLAYKQDSTISRLLRQMIKEKLANQ